MTAKIKETAMRLVFALAAVLSVLAVIFICIFLFAGGAPAFRQIGVLPFLTGQNWRPLQNEFGIFPMIIGSIYVTAGAIVVGVPFGYRHRRVFGSILPCAPVPGAEACGQSAGGYPLHCVRLFSPDGTGAGSAGTVRHFR